MDPTEQTSPLDHDYLRINYYEAGFSYLLPDILELFRGQAAIYQQAIEHHFLQGDVPALAAEAHTLKGAAGSVGAAALAQAAQQLEDSALSGDVPILARLVEQLREVTTLTNSAILAELGHLAAKGDDSGTDFF